MKKAILAVFLMALVLLPIVGLAQETTEGKKILPDKSANEYGICDILTLVNNIVNIVVKIIVPLIATAIIAWAGLRMLTNQGDSDIARQSKMIFLAVAIGLIVMFASYAIVGTVLVGMGYTEDAFNWAPTCQYSG
jgi:hypothetical protein